MNASRAKFILILQVYPSSQLNKTYSRACLPRWAGLVSCSRIRYFIRLALLDMPNHIVNSLSSLHFVELGPAVQHRPLFLNAQDGSGLVAQKSTPKQEGSRDLRGEVAHFLLAKMELPIL